MSSPAPSTSTSAVFAPSSSRLLFARLSKDHSKDLFLRIGCRWHHAFQRYLPGRFLIGALQSSGVMSTYDRPALELGFWYLCEGMIACGCSYKVELSTNLVPGHFSELASILTLIFASRSSYLHFLPILCHPLHQVNLLIISRIQRINLCLRESGNGRLNIDSYTLLHLPI